MRFLWFSLLACFLGTTSFAWAQTALSGNFSASNTAYQSWRTETTARTENGDLHLLSGAVKESNGVLFDRTIQRCSWIEASFEMRIGGADGAGIVFLDEAQTKRGTDYQRFSEWDAPNLAGAIGIGFDTLNPPETDPFNKNGNINNQPEREVSVHWNGIERLKRRSEIEFRAQSAADSFVPVRVRLEWVTGGANISVWIRGETVYDSVFVADIRPMSTRVGFGARSEKANAYCDLRNFQISEGSPIPAAAPRHTVAAITREPITLTTNSRIESLTQFPRSNRQFGRIIAHLTLSEVNSAIDPWDRLGKVYLYDEKGERFELIRFITSYGRAMDWAIDVTDFRPLLTGKKRIEVECLTYSSGWTVNLSFDFCPGPASQYAYRVINLWNGEVEIGNDQKPISEFWKTRTIKRPKDTDKAVIRITATGHGMEPNSDNAAEFMPSERTLTVGTQQYKNLLWKTDVYLNSLRPQAGTWKYDRAGWAPGSIVEPWKTDVSSAVARGQSTFVNYGIAPYINANAGKGNPPFYQFEATAIFYRQKP